MPSKQGRKPSKKGDFLIKDKLENPQIGLVALRFFVGWPGDGISFRSRDVAYLDIRNPSPRYPEIPSAPELSAYYLAYHGARIRLGSAANSWECFDRKLYKKSIPPVSLFEWLTETSCIDRIELIYDKGYWGDRRFDGQYTEARQRIEFAFPRLDDDSADYEDDDCIPSLLQKTWVDSDELLNVAILPYAAAKQFHVKG